MHQEKIRLLENVGLYRPVLATAAKHRVSVDEVVHAAHGRPTSANARAALSGLNPDDRSKLKALPWQHDCPSCGLLTEQVVTCDCSVKGCSVCLPSLPCSGCKQMEKERGEQLAIKQARQREVAAQAKVRDEQRSTAPNR